MGLALGATLGHAALLYTFASDGATPYSFSILEMDPLSGNGTFAIPPFEVGGLTFTQATASITGGTGCFQFGTAGASVTANASTCSAGANAPDGAWQSLFFGSFAPGTYTAFNAASQGIAPAAPDLLTISEVAAWQYTFSNTGLIPYSFSFLELTPLSGTGAFAIAPFQVGGLTFTQATASISGSSSCFQFGTAGASVSANSSTCSAGANAPDGAWQSLFFGSFGPGTYTAFNAASQGIAPAAPNELTVTLLPEPASLALFAVGLALLVFRRPAVRQGLPR
jgi:hypothetical protein